MALFQEFPPKLPIHILPILFVVPSLTFISLSLEPPKTRLRYFNLIIICIYLLLLPIVYRSKYGEVYMTTLTAMSFGWGFKMMIWLKKCLYAEKEKKMGPFYLTMFFWRELPKKRNNHKEATIKNINYYIIRRFILLLFKWVLYEILYRWITYNIPEIPEEIYPVRIFDWITKGIPAFNPFLLFYYAVTTFLVVDSLSLGYDSFLVINGLFLRFLLTLNDDKEFLFFNKQHMKNIKEWCISMIYDTNHMFMYPYLSTSPRNLWSFRWQLFLNESFKELAYLPARNLFMNQSRSFRNAVGVLAAFTMSAILHEYILFVVMNNCSGDNLFFFILHGIIFVIWEAIVGSTKEIEDVTGMKKILEWSIMFTIILITLPGFVEPFIRHPHWLLTSVFTSYKRDPAFDTNFKWDTLINLFSGLLNTALTYVTINF